jgi:hypothetical protein
MKTDGILSGSRGFDLDQPTNYLDKNIDQNPTATSLWRNIARRAGKKKGASQRTPTPTEK